MTGNRVLERGCAGAGRIPWLRLQFCDLASASALASASTSSQPHKSLNWLGSTWASALASASCFEKANMKLWLRLWLQLRLRALKKSKLWLRLQFSFCFDQSFGFITSGFVPMSVL